jgi:alcohol dehydrogenase
LKQEILTGTSHLPALTRYLEDNEIKRVLLVTGKNSYSTSSARSLLEPHLSEVQAIRFHDFSDNPRVEDVSRGIQELNSSHCQAIIAVGGGSVLDMAKLIKAYCDSDAEISSQVEHNNVGLCEPPLVALPTTAGSGSEATEFAVVYVEGKKYSVSDAKLRPNLVFLVPEFTHSAPPYLTAITGMDALTQSIESFWSVNSTELSQEYSKEALNLIWHNLPRAVQENDESARAELMKAAHLAGKAINIAKTTSAHAISYSFTTYHGIPHGHAVALTIAYFCEYNSQVSEQDCNDERGVGHVRRIFSEIQNIVGDIDLENTLLSFIRNLGLNLTIPESPDGVEKDIERILGNINAQRMRNNPRGVQGEYLRKMLQSIILMK